ncbi:hypothetical protein CDV36_005413 [Fusarium kuroshium]|uniref:Uncharacterized protein n=1 Tax=Fusarium kuroshium TaxID=2010991 RepID=A0A3M2SBJ8_9HYPO|nr:hypothetical protein CDV36_005413 [Fusarium kuroshium]
MFPNTLLQTPNVTALSAVKDHSVFQTPELPAADNTLQFGPPRHGFTPGEYSTIRGSPGLNTILKTPNATGLGITRGANH